MSTPSVKSENCIARGDLRIAVRCVKTGTVIRRLQIKNTITADGLTALVNVFRQTDPMVDYRFKEIRVGTGITLPLRSDFDLAAPLIPPVNIALTQESTQTSQTADPFEIRVLATLGADQANGSMLTEAAIGMMNDKIFSRQTHAGIAKNDALVFDYDWRITITA